MIATVDRACQLVHDGEWFFRWRVRLSLTYVSHLTFLAVIYYKIFRKIASVVISKLITLLHR